MDPINNNPQSENPAIEKLEEDLKVLEQEASSTQQPTVPAPDSTFQIPNSSPAVNFPPPPSNHKSPLILIAIVLVVLALLAAIAYAIGMQFFGSKNILPTTKACTEEAKLCSGGSYVGRTGPNCEFAECPTIIETPTAVPTMTATPSGTPLMTPIASPSSTPTSSPSATPSI